MYISVCVCVCVCVCVSFNPNPCEITGASDRHDSDPESTFLNNNFENLDKQYFF